MKLNKGLSLLSLATRAGKTKSGNFQTEQAVKSGTAYLVIIAADASENTKKKFRNMCSFYDVPILFMQIRTPWVMQWEKNSAQVLR